MSLVAGALGLPPSFLNQVFLANIPAMKGVSEKDPRSVLLKLAKTLAQGPISSEYYEALFDWRISHMPEYSQIYADVVEMLDWGARRTVNTSFAQCSGPEAEDIVFDYLPAAAGGGTGVFEENPRLWETYSDRVRHEILAIYALIDAPAEVGLVGLTGLPRGLGVYTAAPVATGGDKLSWGEPDE